MRPCKYGERVNGKCPPKPKTKKERACKYGKRVNGKCPPKAKTLKTRPCKYGERINSKCPPKPKTGLKKNTPTPTSLEVILYENGVRKTFDDFSGQELSSVSDYVTDMLKIYDTDIVYRGEDDEEMIVKNVNYGERKYPPLNEKIPVKLQNYGVNKWGKVELMFIPLKI